MGLKKLINRYNAYEDRVMTERAERIRKAAPYKSLVRKSIVKAKIKAAIPKGKLTKKRFTEAIGNPYNVKFPKARKTLKKIKKAKR